MANYSEFINRLSSQTGLHTDVLAAWVNREKGINNNILGVTSGGSLVKYPSQTAAADATAALLMRSSNYAGIRASLQGTSEQQALAIAQSPWRLGGSGLAKQGGTDPYYYKGFVEAGILAGNTSRPSGGTSTPITPTDTTSTLAQYTRIFTELGISTDPSHTITPEEATKLDQKLPLGVRFFTGKTVGQFLNYDPTNIDVPDPTEWIPDIPGALMFVAVVLIGLTFLILGGLIGLRKK